MAHLNCQDNRRVLVTPTSVIHRSDGSPCRGRLFYYRRVCVTRFEIRQWCPGPMSELVAWVGAQR